MCIQTYEDYLFDWNFILRPHTHETRDKSDCNW